MRRRGANLCLEMSPSAKCFESVSVPVPCSSHSVPCLSSFHLLLFPVPVLLRMFHSASPLLFTTSWGTTHFCAQTKTLCTLSAMTLANAFSGCSSKGAPHVAPAFAKRMSTCGVCFSTSLTNRSTSPGFARSAGTEMAWPLPGSAFSAAHASSQALAFREVMKTLEQPAWIRLVDCEVGSLVALQ